MSVRHSGPIEFKKPTAGGDGLMGVTSLLTRDEFYGTGRLFATILLKPGCSINWHQHQKETEYYFILAGEGIFTNPDGTDEQVYSGDLCLIKPNEWHAIKNDSDADLTFIALIIHDMTS